MATRSCRGLALATALLVLCCRRSPERVQPEQESTPGALTRATTSASAAPTMPPEVVSEVLTPRAVTGSIQWFDPPQQQLDVFSVSGVPLVVLGEKLYRAAADRFVEVPLRFAEDDGPKLMPEIVRVEGRYPGHLWVGRISNRAARTTIVDLYRQQPDGAFARYTSDTLWGSWSSEWDGERRLLPATGTLPMRWLDSTGQETPARLTGPPKGCVRSAGLLVPATSRGWVLEAMTCRESASMVTFWLFDPSGQGRRLEGFVAQQPQALLVRPDGDTWFVVSGPGTSLCHLTGSQARCEKIPTTRDEGWAQALGERGDDLTLVASDGLWTYHTGTFTREPLPMPGSSQSYVVTAVRDQHQQIWGVAREGTAREPGRYRLFRHAP